MKFSLSGALLTVACATVLLATAFPARALDYPVRPIKVIVSFPPGGATDVVARVLAQRLSERLKQPVIVENRPGAGGAIGTEFTAKAAPDGYTLTFTANNHVIRPHLSKELRFDPMKDFTFVAMVGNLPSAFIVNPKLPVTTIAQFVEYARARPGKLTYGSWGVGSSPHVRIEMFKAENKIDLLHVPFQGAAPALTAVMSGEVDMMMIPLAMVEGYHRAGRIRMLGVTTARRSPAAPEVPTFAEQGVPLTGGSWQGFLGPAHMSADIVAFLNHEINALVEEAHMRETLAKNGIEASTSTPQEFKAYLEAEYVFWGKAIRMANIPKE